VSAGLIEVDDELMWCTDVSTNTVTVSLRGMYGTTAAAHTTGTSVLRNNPRFPRASIKRAINDTIRAVYPDLYAIDDTTFTSSIVSVGYELPADVEEVLDVTVDAADGTDYWRPVNRYRVYRKANTTAFATGRYIEIRDAIEGNRTVQVVYTKVPAALAANTDVFDTTTGLQESARECIVYGACARLAGYLEPARLQTNAAEATLMADQHSGAMLNAARYYYQLHLQARSEEARRLQDKYPPRIHWLR
jgi:hypothetical protein